MTRYQNFDPDKLQRLLEELYDQLSAKGQLAPGVDKQTIIQNVMHDFKQGNEFHLSFTHYDNVSVIKSLSAILVNESVNTYGMANSAFITPKLNMVKLFKDLPDMDQAKRDQLKLELEQYLKAQMEKILQYKLQRSLTGDEKSKVAMMAKHFSNQMIDNANTEVMKDQFLPSMMLTMTAFAKAEAELSAKELADRSVNAGASINIAGGQIFPVLGIQEGMRAGYTIQTQGVGDGLLEAANRYDLGADPLGIEAATLQCEIATGTLPEEIVDDLMNANILDSPTPKNTPPLGC